MSVKAGRRAAGYLRVSQERNARDGYGLDAQEADVHRFAEYRRLALVGVYREEGASGYERERPELARLIADAEAGKWDVAVFPSVDRAGRSVKDVIEIDRTLRESGVEVVFVREGVDTTTAVGEFFTNVMASLAQLEGQIAAERMSKGRRRKAAGGGYVGGWLPYGYACVDGAVVVVPEEAEAVRLIFELRAAGVAYQDIAWRLIRDGIPARLGGTWRISTLRGIVGNPFYTGRREVAGKAVTGQHEPIVSHELFRRVAALVRRTRPVWRAD
jgi:site-specific DNA recombinase